jgi:hypothetical protein
MVVTLRLSVCLSLSQYDGVLLPKPPSLESEAVLITMLGFLFDFSLSMIIFSHLFCSLYISCFSFYHRRDAHGSFFLSGFLFTGHTKLCVYRLPCIFLHTNNTSFCRGSRRFPKRWSIALRLICIRLVVWPFPMPLYKDARCGMRRKIMNIDSKFVFLF